MTGERKEKKKKKKEILRRSAAFNEIYPHQDISVEQPNYSGLEPVHMGHLAHAKCT